jgi:hypothetical protein
MKTTNRTAASTCRTTGTAGVCWSQLIVVVYLSATMSRVVASSDFSPNTPPPPPPPHLSYVYSEINSMEYKDSNNNEEETEEENRGNPEWRYPTHDLHPHRQESLDRDESSSSFSTTEGGWFHVSGQAIMCHGGESYQQEQDHPVLYVDASILNSVDPDFSERDYEAEEDDNNDDDEDDDNDGHSSMLSNSAALYRRPRAMVGSGTVAASTSDQDSSYYTSSSYGDATTAESSTSNTYDMKGRQVTLQQLPLPEQAQRKPWGRTLPITKAFSPHNRI